jgi:hypothetical protein
MLTAQSGDAGGMTWAVAGSGAIARRGGNTNEATTTSTSEVELRAISSLTIAAGTPVDFMINARKTSGAAAACSLGLRINSTITGDTTADGGWNSSTTSRAEDGGQHLQIFPRVTNYQGGVYGTFRNATGGANVQTGNFGQGTATNVVPIAEVTDIDILGVSDNGSNTLAVDEMHVYDWAVS